MTSGPWKPIRLESYTRRITDFDIRSKVSEKLDVLLSASACVGPELLSASGVCPLTLSFTLKNSDGSILKSLNGILLDESGCAKVTWEWPPEELRLWYPVGYGEQSLYVAEVALLDEVQTFSLVKYVVLFHMCSMVPC